MDNHKEHNHHHHHHEHDVSSMNRKSLFLVILFNLIITIAEIIGGLISGSLSLVSDAIHNLSDTASLILSYVSIKIAERPKSKTKTYGYKRANILAAFTNSAVLIGIATFLIVEAAGRFFNPQHINGNTVIIVAIIGLLGNFLSALFLKKGSKESINIKSSYLHMMSDAFSSLAVLASGILIKYFHVYWLDPILTVFINAIIIKASYEILKESIEILMQGTEINIDEMQSQITKITGIKGIHHIHVWSLDENNIMLEAHILVQDMLISETKEISDEIEHILKEHFNINHIIIKFESVECTDDNCLI